MALSHCESAKSALFIKIKSLFKSVNTSASVNQLLLACKERMAF